MTFLPQPVDSDHYWRAVYKQELPVWQPAIAEIDINPLLASPQRLLALDARVVLHAPDTDPDHLPRPAIRPYPSQYVCRWTMKNGTEVTLRPIRPEDEPLMVMFHQALSDRSVYMRYFYSLSLSSRVAHDRLVRICFVDYDREMAIVAEHQDIKTGQHRILGVGRLVKSHARNEGEVAVLISDSCQNQGLGMELFRRVIQVARDEKLSRVYAEILPENFAMKKIAKKLGFRSRMGDGPTSTRAALDF